MDQEPNLIREDPDTLRLQIDETRSSLTEKLETLEDQVRDTVQGAKNTVEYTIENVKSTVQDTVDSVKRTFDIPHQVDQHPWPMMGISSLAGFVAGSLLSRLEPRTQVVMPGARFDHRNDSSPSRGADHSRAEISLSGVAERDRPTSTEPGVVDRVMHQFDSEIQTVKGMAIGAALGIARDLAKQYLPRFAREIHEVADNVTRKMGGRPFDKPVLDIETNGAHAAPAHESR